MSRHITLKTPGDETYRTIANGSGESLEIYNSQYNIAQEVYLRWLNRGLLKKGRKFDYLNVLFVGPCYADLRQQTVDDLASLAAEEALFGPDSPGDSRDLRLRCSELVFNSNRLKAKQIKHEDVEDAEDAEDAEVDSKEYDRTLSHIPFITALKQDDQGEHLHLLIHDEAHWGIKVDSLLEKFFLRILEIMNIPENKRNLLILLVSATSEVIMLPVTKLRNLTHRVAWNDLATSGKAAFRSPLYRSVEELSYFNDHQMVKEIRLKEIQLMEKKDPPQMEDSPQMEKKDPRQMSIALRADLVVQHYIEAAKIVAGICAKSQSPRVNDLDRCSVTQHVLWELIAPYSTNATTSIFGNGSSNDYGFLRKYQPKAERNRIVVVRVHSQDDAEKLATEVSNAFFYELEFCPFEVIRYISKTTVWEQLSPRAQAYFGKEVNRVKDLVDIPVLIVVVAKLSMGERLPSNCTIFDVRAPYRGTWSAVNTGSKTKFVQDVGRCAGHKKDKLVARIVTALEDDCERFPLLHTPGKIAPSTPGSPPSPTPLFESTHPLLSPKKRLANVSHTENVRNEKVYSRLQDYTVLLDAAPQIGKTGSFLSLVEIIFREHINISLLPPFESSVQRQGESEAVDEQDEAEAKEEDVSFYAGIESKEELDEGEHSDEEEVNNNAAQNLFGSDAEGSPTGDFAQRCTFLRQLINTLGYDAMEEWMQKPVFFAEFHSLLLASRESLQFNTNELLIERFVAVIVSEHDNQLTWRVADCGCGMHGFAPSMNEVLHKTPKRWARDISSMYVLGIDINSAIAHCMPEDSHAKLTFETYLGDSAQAPDATDPDSLYDFVVFNCSLYRNDTQDHLAWAHRNLRPAGHLILVELQRRLPDGWEGEMTKMGWVYSEFFPSDRVSTYTDFPYVSSVWQKSPTVDFSEDGKLILLA